MKIDDILLKLVPYKELLIIIAFALIALALVDISIQSVAAVLLGYILGVKIVSYFHKEKEVNEVIDKAKYQFENIKKDIQTEGK